MTITKKEIIKKIIENVFFSNEQSAYSRASDIIIKNNNIGFSLDINGISKEEAENTRAIIIQKLENTQKFKNITIILTSNNQNEDQVKNQNKTKTSSQKIKIDGVKKIILIASGKGGVGKSTIASLIAHKLKQLGNKVGILDADIYGPSIPTLFDLSGKPELDGNKMIPLEKYGIAVNSIGFLTKESASISWRGPMVSKALYQLLSLTKWQNLDYLIIDSPPGTGDIHLSLLQNYFIDDVLMVTTPQKIAQVDVERAINLYKKFNINIKGIIENMSFYKDPKTGVKTNIFGGNGGDVISDNFKIPIIARIPIITALSEDCDLGNNIEKHTNLINNFDF